MDADRWQLVERVLDRALLSDPASWPTLIENTCSGDPELRAEVEALLAQHSAAERFLESPPVTAAAALVAEAKAARAPIEGRRIGAFGVVRLIGRGGMSRVYLAERADGEFEQQVALKLLRPGLDSELDLERLRAERQILATLNHPNIGRLFDGGVTDDGLPYLVLEYVRGEPIDKYCATRQASIAERLRLFLDIADAVQYAHRNLVVHRDLKPSNILVTTEGRVKLLDFGLAKLLGGELAPGDLAATRTNTRWMTPAYAAPEQVLGQPVTTVTDVYQLGVVLYELLTGRLPFAERARTLREMEDAILHEEPPAPSLAVKALRGDLEAIVLKALRKEPDQRYDSVAAFADDLRRHVSGHPVLARRQSLLYRVRRFLRRNGPAVVGVAAVVVLLGAYVGTVVVERGRVRRALAEAQHGTRKAEQVTDFMLGLFEASEGGRALTDTVTARELLSRGLAEARAMSAQPALQAQMLDVIGRLYLELGDVDRARPLVEEALGIRRRVYGEDHPEVASSLESVAAAAERKGDVGVTVKLRRDALALRRRVSGEADPRAVDAMFDLAYAMHQSGEIKGATALFDQWMMAVAKQPEDLSVRRANQLTSLGELLQFGGDRAKAGSAYREALTVRRAVYGTTHPQVASSLLDLSLLSNRGAEADSLAREAVSLLRVSYPDGHPELANGLRTHGIILQRLGRHREASVALREALGLRRRLLGANSVEVARTEVDLALSLATDGDAREAESLARDAERIYRLALGGTSMMVDVARQRVGDALRAQGKYDEAETILLAVFERFETPRPITRPWRFATLTSLVKLYEAQGRSAEAEKYRALLDPPR
jgi:tetratricopeptide (TPR) repeat protein/tRNA A-37 threonylcarbamoyl transferase component Bud32